MVTPTKPEIIDKAFELHHEKNHNVSSINPTVKELKEDGTFEQAKRELMRNDHSYRDYIEQEARSLGLLEEKAEEKRETSKFTVDLRELMRTGCFSSGTSGSGKTFLNFVVADRLMEKGVIVFVVDPSQVWSRSNVPHRIRIDKLPATITFEDGNARNGKLIQNGTVFDVSMLTYKERVEFTEDLCKWLLNKRKRSKVRPPTFVFFEEGHLYFYEGSMRSLKRQSNAVELVTNGRNFNIRYGVICQFPSMIDKVLIKITRQRWFGCTSEPNDLRYIEDIIGSEMAEQLSSLETGEFVYSYPKRNSKPRVIRVPKFEQKRRFLIF